MKPLLLGLLCFCGVALAQSVQQVLPNPDCQIFFALTAAGQNSAVVNNLQNGCTSWQFSYTVTGFSAVSLVLQSAANNAGSPGSFSTGFPVQQTVVSGSNPGTSTTAGFFWVQGTNAFARMHLTTGTGTGMVQGALFGWRIPNAASQGGGGGAITCLTGDVTAGSGGGCTTATVVGIESVPFCSGYTPTNGQFVQYTTGSSPNPCYTAAPASATTGNKASIVTYTPSASVTLTCPSATAGTVVQFDPSGTALAANMAVTFAGCTAGEIVTMNVIQAASGGPFTISGLPTGSPQLLTYPSSTTVYTLQAATATTMTFVNVAGISGSSSLGSGANGISRTITAGSGGVTANLLAAKDATNPTRYVLPGASGCGSGVAAYSATAGNTSELYTVPGTVVSMIADGTITAGHILTGGSSTPGRVADTGQTARTAVALGTCIVGIALQSATVGGAVLVAFDGTGIYGAGAASSVSFSGISSGTNTTAAMAVGTGASLDVSGSGTINATTLGGSSKGTSGATIPLLNGANTYSGVSIFQNSSDSTTAFRVLNAAGTTAVLNVDTTNKRVGIGTVTPTLALDIFSITTGDGFFVTAPGAQFSLSDSGASGIKVGMLTKRGGTAGLMSIFDFTNSRDVLTYNANTNIVTFPEPLVFSGLAAASGTPDSLCISTNTVVRNAALTCTVSSILFKMRVSPLEVSATSLLTALRPTEFAYKDNPDRLRWGFIAEQVSQVDRRLGDGFTPSGDPRSLDQNAILALLVKGFQELNSRISK
jgi:hypothetical protein